MRCLLIEHDIGPILIDTGAGNKEDAKFYDIYGIENRGEPGPTRLEDGIREAGFTPEQIVLVINSHLHFDHAGGNTIKDSSGDAPGVSERALRDAARRVRVRARTPTSARRRATSAHNFVPLAEAGLVDFIEGEREIVPGIRAIPTPGHTPHHQGLLIESQGRARVLHRRPRADGRAPAAGVDHGLRRRAAGDARDEASNSRARRRGGLARRVRARSRLGVGQNRA